MLRLPPAVIVHGAPDVTAVLAIGRPFTLLSAPGAALYAGCGWWRALADEARRRAPGLIEADILDCADAAGRALAALRLGQAHLVVWATAPGHAAVAATAHTCHAVLLDRAPPACDLGQPGGVHRLAEWLATAPHHHHP